MSDLVKAIQESVGPGFSGLARTYSKPSSFVLSTDLHKWRLPSIFLSLLGKGAKE